MIAARPRNARPPARISDPVAARIGATVSLALSAVVAALLPLLGSGAALAGPNSGGVLILHANVSLPFTLDTNWSGWSELRNCKDAVTQVPGDGKGVIFYVLAAWPFGAPRMKAVCFGIKYSSNLVAPAACGACIDPAANDWELQQSGWPANGTGTAIEWNEPLTRSIDEVYWFACYAYDGNTFQLTPHPDPGLGGQFADDSLPLSERDDIESYGMLGFGSRSGFNPCGGDEATGGCCLAEGQCVLRTRGGCQGMIGTTYLGDNTTCYPNPCTPGIGACCFGPRCQLMDWNDCTSNGGSFELGSGCDPTPCIFSSVDGNWGQIKQYYRAPN